MGESLHDALKREIREETNLELIQAEFLCYQEFIFDESFYEKRHFIFFDFICQVEEGEVQLNSEAQDYVWVDLPEAYSYPIDSYLRYSLDLYQNVIDS
jgi:ADP-ribose pyrophosphatase YjhB (NUDIX family)